MREVATIYAVVSSQTNYLCHFGTLGMRWGIRKYQNKDGSLTPEGRERYLKAKEKAASIADKNYGEKRNKSYAEQQREEVGIKSIDKDTDLIPKGAVFHRVTDADEKISNQRKYVSILNVDNETYEEFGRYGELGDGLEKRTVLEMESTKPLKVATQEKVKAELDRLIGDRTGYMYMNDFVADRGRAEAERLMKDYGNIQLKDFLVDRATAFTYSSVSGKLSEKELKKDKWISDYLTTGSDIVLSASNRVLSGSDPKSKEFYKSLKDQGYDAFVDYNDYFPGTMNYPLVLMNPSESVKKKNVRKI